MSKIFFIFLFILYIHIQSIIVFPFSISSLSDKRKRMYYVNDFLSDNLHIDFFTSLFIGKDSTKVLSRLSIDNSSFILTDNECNLQSLDTIYNYGIVSRWLYSLHESSTYKNISNSNIYNKGGIISEIISLYNTTYLTCQQITLPKANFINENNYIDNKVTINEMKIIIKNYENNRMCVLIGLGSPYINSNQDINLINELKINGIIKEYSWSFNFMTSSEGQLVIGGLPHEYMNSKFYEEHQFIVIKSYSINDYNFPWSILFNQIYFENSSKEKIIVEKNIKSILLANFGLIIGTSEYKKLISENFFNDLIQKHLCEIKVSTNLQNYINQFRDLKNGIFEVFTCKKDIIYNKQYSNIVFPNLYLQQNDYNFTFSLSFYNLFIEIKNEFYFMVIFQKNSEHLTNEKWYLGLPFLRQYQFVYNYDSKTIGFYNPNIMKNEIKNIGNNITNTEGSKININLGQYSASKIILEIFIISILLVFAYFIGKKINEHRKKRANELKDDNYEYFSSDINAIDKMNKSNIKSNYKEIKTNSDNKSLEMSSTFEIK